LRGNLQKVQEVINTMQTKWDHEKLEHGQLVKNMQDDFDRKMEELKKFQQLQLDLLSKSHDERNIERERHHQQMIDVLNRQIDLVKNQNSRESNRGIIEGIVSTIASIFK